VGLIVANSEEGDRYEDYEKYSDHLPGGRFTPARHKSSVKDSTETEEDRERREEDRKRREDERWEYLKKKYGPSHS
jgi:hypothetical protein